MLRNNSNVSSREPVLKSRSHKDEGMNKVSIFWDIFGLACFMDLTVWRLQLGERYNGIAEVVGSIPSDPTAKTPWVAEGFCPFWKHPDLAYLGPALKDMRWSPENAS